MQKKNLQIASELDNMLMVYESRIDISYLYSQKGMFFEARELLDSINQNALTDKWLIINLNEAYKYLYSLYPEDSEYASRYYKYRDQILSMRDPDSEYYKVNYIEKLIDAKAYNKAREIALQILNEHQEETKWYATLTNLIGKTYQRENNYDMQKIYYARSAIYDIKNAIKENISIRSLAIAFYETGDIERAYKYIHKSMEDAIFANVRFRTIEVSQLMPVIENSYQQKISMQNDRLFKMLMLIGFLSIFLIISVIYVYKQMKRLSKARKSLYHANQDLDNLNKSLKEMNSKLSEANHLKEEYIARYMDQCSSYLEKMEEYRRNLNKKAAAGKTEELYKALKSKQFLEDEIKEFYANFDKTFLELFPNFIDRFNALLEEDARITPKPKELLNTELRIFALIRLGITDSTKIAQFMRSPVSTVYTYRTKIRKRSLYDKEEFEQQVMKIGIDNSAVKILV